MSAGYDGNIKLGVSVTADSKSVVAELGALRKQIVDMFSSVDKSLAGGSGSFSNLEKSLSKIATDVGNISKVINGLPTSHVAKVVEMVKEVGTAAQQSGDAVKSAFDFNAETASTEELYQKLKQLRAEADAIKQQKLAEGFSPVQANNSKDVRIRENQASAIADELRNRGLSDKNDYMPATNFSGDIGDMQVKNLEDALKQAYEALHELQSGLSSMNEDDAGFAEKTARANELTQAIANLNEQLGFEKARISGVSASTDGANPKTQTVSSYNMGYDVSGMKYIEIASAQGKEAAEAFINQYNEVLNSQGREAADAFAKSFNVVSGSGDSMIAQYKRELAELQSRMKDFDKLKITMSDEEVGKTLNRIEELKAKLAELTRDAKFFTIDVPVDDGLRDSMMAMQELQAKMKQFQQTGTGFGSMEEAQNASVRIADLSKSIQDYFRNLDPAVQKLNEYRQALADVGTAEASMKSGKKLTAEEVAQYEAASAKVKEYANDLGSLIQIRNALKAQVGQFEKTGVGMNNAELEQSKTLLSELNARINQLNGNQPKFDMTISNQSIVDAKRNLDELIAKKKQMEAQGMSRGYAEYDSLCAQLDMARQRYDSLTYASARATTAMSGIQKANSALNRIGSTISRLIKHVGSLITSFRRLGSAGSLAGLDISKGFRRGFTTFLKYGLGIRSIFMLFRRLRSSAVSAFDAMAQSDSGLNAELAHTKELMQNFKLSIGTAVQPLVSALLPAINAIIAALTRALTAIGTFFAALTGQGYIYKATASGIAGVGGAAKKAKADLMGFDELNKLSDDNGGGGGGGGGGGFKKVPIDPNSAIAKFAEMIKKAWETGDFFDVGAFLGEKLKAGLEKVNTWITTEGFALAKKLGNSFATLINGFISVDGLPETIGKTVGNAINMAMIGLHQFLTVTEWLDVGKFIADVIMSGFKTVNWELLGQTVGSYIMAFVDSIYGFITNIDFEAIGKYIATAINNIFDVMGTVDETGLNGWQKIGKSLSDGITGLLEMILKAIKEVDWGKIGQAIGDFIKSIDFGEIAWDVTALIANLVAAIAEGLWGWAKTEPISAALASMLGLAVIGTKIAPTVVNAIELFKKFKDVLSIMDTVDDLGTALNAAFGPGSVIAGIGMVIGGAITAISSFFSMLKNGFSWLKEILMVVGIAIAAIGAVILGIPATVAAVVAAVVAAIATAVVLIKEHWSEICKWFSNLSSSISQWFDEAGTAINDWLANSWESISTWCSDTWNEFCEWVSNVGTSISEGIDALGTVINDWLANTWTTISTWFTEIWTAITEWFTNLGTSIIEWFTTTYTAVSEWFTNVWTTISEWFTNLLTSVVEWLTVLWTSIVETVSLWIEGIVTFFTTIWTTIWTIISEAMLAITEFFTTAWTNIQIIFQTIWTAISNVVSTIFTTIQTKITTIITNIKTTITSALTIIQSTFSSVLKSVKSTVDTIFNGIKTGITTAMNSVKSSITSILTAIKSTFVSIWNGIKSAVLSIANGMHSAIVGVMNGIGSAVRGVGSSVRGAINAVIRCLNGLHFTIPSWVPGWGGRSFGFNIPYLAQGAVIPPNKEFMAVLGDQRHGTNIEAPLDTIKQAVAEELSEYIDAMMAGFEAVVSAIDNKDMDVTIGDTDIGQAAERYNNRQKLVRGTT